jgi:hypothetical protein
MFNLNDNYIRNCRSQLSVSGFTKSVYSDFDETTAVLSKLTEILVADFTLEISRLKNPHDILAFLYHYTAENQTEEGQIAFKQLCRYVFILIPKLKFSNTAQRFFSNNGEVDYSSLMNLSCAITELAQFYGLSMVAQKAIGAFLISDAGWSFHYLEDSVGELVKRYQIAVHNGALSKYCDDDFVAEIFIATFRDAFKPVEEELYDRIYCTNGIDLNAISERDFVRIVRGEIPMPGIIDITDICDKYKDNPLIKGLTFTSSNSDLYQAIMKPHNVNYRTRFRPIIAINIDERIHYVTTQSMYFEAMSEIASGQFAHNNLPQEWSNIIPLKDKAKEVFKQHSDSLEKNAACIVGSRYQYKTNVTSLGHVSCETAKVRINNVEIPGKRVGEIDLIVIDKYSQTVYVIDAKYLKPIFYVQSFSVDANKFRKEGGYEDKLNYKVNWVKSNLDLLCIEFKCDDISQYSVEGFFVTDNLVYYSLFSKFPIIPITNLLAYLSTHDRYCFLPPLNQDKQYK